MCQSRSLGVCSNFVNLYFVVAVFALAPVVCRALDSCVVSQQQPSKSNCVLLRSGVSFPVASSRVRLCAFSISVFCWSLGSVPVFCIGVRILGLGHIYLLFFFALLVTPCLWW